MRKSKKLHKKENSWSFVRKTRVEMQSISYDFYQKFPIKAASSVCV